MANMMDESPRVLLVGENPDEPLREMLSRHCRIVHTADTRDDALTVIQTGGVDAVVAEMSLITTWPPGSCANLVAASLAVPVVVVTSRERQQAAQETMLSGVQEVLVREELDEESLFHSIRQARLRLGSGDRRYQTLFDSAPDAVMVVDGKGQVTSCSPRAEQLYERSMEAMLGAELMDFVDAKSREVAQEKWPKLRQFVPQQCELRVTRADGSPVDVWRKAVPLKDSQGRFDGALIYDRDITDRKRIEVEREQLRQHLEEQVSVRTKELRRKNDELLGEISRRRLAEEAALTALETNERIFQTAANGMRVVGADFTTLKANSAFAKLCGRPLAEIVGSKCYDSFAGEHCDSPQCTLRRIKAGAVVRELEVHKQGATGQLLCALQATPLLDGQGRFVGMIEDFQDLTDQKRFQSIAEAVNLAENIGHVFGGIRHELGNPVNNMKATLTVLKNTLPELSTDEIAEHLQWAFAEISRVEFLLQSLKSFNLFESLSCERLDLTKFVEQFRPLVNSEFSNRGIDLQLKCPSSSVWVDADPRALQQALLNIVSNAADAVAERKEPRITVQCVSGQQLVHLLVEDNGCGMTRSQLENVFKPFHTNKKKGTGLGMPIVRKLLAKMNSIIEVDSKQDTGTWVSVFMPAAEPPG